MAKRRRGKKAKVGVARYPGGQTRRETREEPEDPRWLNKYNRLMKFADTKRDPRWGAVLTRMALAKEIGAAEFSAGLRLEEIVTTYRRVWDVPDDKARVASMEGQVGRSLKVVSPSSAKRVQRIYAEAMKVLETQGAVDVAIKVCVRDEIPGSYEAKTRLRGGLAALAATFFKVQR